jgi:hypothetical protein
MNSDTARQDGQDGRDGRDDSERQRRAVILFLLSILSCRSAVQQYLAVSVASALIVVPTLLKLAGREVCPDAPEPVGWIGTIR